MIAGSKTKPDLLSRRLFGNAGQHGPLVLMYHAVTPGKASTGWRWEVTGEQFSRQMELLHQNGWQTASVASLLSASGLSPRTVVITFDDGYANSAVAMDALLRYGMCATWFIVSDFIGKKADWGDGGREPGYIMTGSEIRTLSEAGMEIGSHTCTHCRLTEVDDARLQRELHDSRERLGDIIGKQVPVFAYPYGIYNDHVVDRVAATGYRAACTTRSGWALVDGKPLQIRRLSIYADDSLSTFARKLAFASNDAGWVNTLRYLSGYALRKLGSA